MKATSLMYDAVKLPSTLSRMIDIKNTFPLSDKGAKRDIKLHSVGGYLTLGMQKAIQKAMFF